MVAGEIRYPFGGELRFKLEERGRLLTFVVSASRPATLHSGAQHADGLG